jgi:hypothetical protein
MSNQKLKILLSESFENKIISKITISLKNKEKIESNISIESIDINELKAVYIKTILIKKEEHFSFLYRFPTKDLTKNYSFEFGMDLILKLLGSVFFQLDVFLLDKSIHILFDKNGNLKWKEKTLKVARKLNLEHNKVKSYILNEGEADFLKILGVFSEDGKLKSDKRDKFKQINKYLEFFAQIIKELDHEHDLEVFDMGSGKGYLTFAMYHYLNNILNVTSKVVGVEYRNDMVELCNYMAKKADFEGLGFMQGSIETTEIAKPDILVALHACDTATDEALFRGISLEAKAILVSPCCHKQIRKNMLTQKIIQPITKFGILEERQAEILTDTIRALILEAYGYQTKVFEFISSEHTPKNLLITAVKKRKAFDPTKMAEIETLKSLFGIKYHHLQGLLESK